MTEEGRVDRSKTGEDPVEEHEVANEEINSRLTAAEGADFSDLDPRVTSENLREPTLHALRLCGLPLPPIAPGSSEADQAQKPDDRTDSDE